MNEKKTYVELEEKILKLEETVDALKRSASLLRDEIKWRHLLIEESREAIVVLNHKGGVYEANNRFAEMIGYSRDEVYRLYVWDWDIILKKEQILELIHTVSDIGQYFETQHRRKDGKILDIELSNNAIWYGGEKLVLCICRDISEKKRVEKLINNLKKSLTEVKTFTGILPLCSFCKKIRDDTGHWERVDVFINNHSKAEVSHSICPRCMKKYYPLEYEEISAEQLKKENGG